eukprot:XP_001691462.1 predicted protein [Chlamydomonas reinhardtii]
MRSLQRCPLATGPKPQISHIEPVNDDNMLLWRLRVLPAFDEDVAAGRQLNADLRRLGQMRGSGGQDYILMEVSFPQDYPTNPFFLRVVSPRCVMYTGHVTAGGSICIEALVATGGPGGWQPDYCVEAVLVLVLANMLTAEVAQVRTATGPGGISGPLRVDLSAGLAPYSDFEARAAYDRTVANHGWRPAAAGAGGGGNAAAAPTAGQGVPPGVVSLLDDDDDDQVASKRRKERAAIKELVANGLSADDARELLLEQCGGDLDAALGVAMQSASFLSRSRVVRVERVQNWRMWTKYCIRRSEILETLREEVWGGGAAGRRPKQDATSANFGSLNEFYMWHGTSNVVIEAVVRDGFDMREASRAGSLGEGIYFAANASYSLAYTLSKQALKPAPGAYGGFAGAAGGTAAATRAGGAPQQQPQQAPLVFPGSAGAMLLCRVAMGRLTAGGMGMRKPPKGYDSVHMGSTAQSLAAATALQAAEAADGTGEVWEVQRVLGRDLIVTVFDNMQAYPEYIVHFN